MKAFFETLAGICIINLTPSLMAFLMFFVKKTSTLYLLLNSIKSLFSIPTSLIGFALQYDLGD